MEIQIPVILSSRFGSPTVESLEVVLNRVMDEMVEPEGYDIDCTATLKDHLVVFNAYADNEPSFDAVFGAVRAALHGAGIATPGWEISQASWETDMRRIELVAA